MPRIDWTGQLGWIVANQGILATGNAFWAQIVVLRNLAAVSANLTLIAVPLVGGVSSALLVGERVTLALIGGLVLIITGVTLNLFADQMGGITALAAVEPESQP